MSPRMCAIEFQNGNAESERPVLCCGEAGNFFGGKENKFVFSMIIDRIRLIFLQNV